MQSATEGHLLRSLANASPSEVDRRQRLLPTSSCLSARAICCASCLILFFAWRSGRNEGLTDNSDDYELSLVGSVLRPNLAGLSVPSSAI